MILTQLSIYSAAEQLTAVLSNELPEACPIKSIERIQKALDGGGKDDTLVFSVPAAHADAAHIMEDGYAGFWDEDGYFQLYRILKTERSDAGENEDDENAIIASCEHVFYELLGDWIEDKRPTNTTAALAIVQLLNGTRWQLGTADDLGVKSVRVYDKSVLAGLVAVAAKWGGELNFRLDIIGGVIAGRYVDIVTRRGADTGKRFERGKDLVSVKQTIDKSSVCTALYGRGKGEEIITDDPNDPGYGRRISFADVVWSVANSDPADKPEGQAWIGDDTARAAFGPGGRHIFDRMTFDSVTDPEELLRLTYEELQKRREPLQTYQLDVMLLEHLAGYEHEAVRLGDTNIIINTSFIPALVCEARIIELRTNYIDPNVSKTTLGNYIPGIQDEINNVAAQQGAMVDRQGVWDRSGVIEPNTSGGGELEYRMDLLRVQLMSTISGMSTDQNGNLIFENPTKTAAMKLGAGIFALASGRLPDDSDYEWRFFGDGHGATADEIVTGTLRASVVFAGQLMSAFGSFTDLIAGVNGRQRLHMGADASFEPFIRMYDQFNNAKLALDMDEITYPNGMKIGEFSIGGTTGVGFF